MHIIKHVHLLKDELAILKKQHKKIGFVPTMGALHQGHISLITKANEQNDVSVCSIFVNPTQFNNKADLQKYPITTEADIELLTQVNCSILFLPTEAEMYPQGYLPPQYKLGYIETILEGKYRAGHFEGVCIIVDKLLQAVMPDVLYLGQKDYQQCMVIKKMMDSKPYGIRLTICETVREPDGLAMSSRNKRLTAEERVKATKIIQTLRYIQMNKHLGTVSEVVKKATSYLVANGFVVDYVAVADANTLKPITYWNKKKKPVALVAAYLNEVRLIDNITL